MRCFSAFGLCLWLLAALPAAAEEYIRSYHSDISVAGDGMLTVAETITVNAEGLDIRRGIFRDFPLTMRDADGRTVRVDMEVQSVERDGRAEDWHTESITGGTRIYAGSKDVTLPRGMHTYVITYRSDRQIRFFPDHDELYWNVTGNGWQFRIASASAKVNLPGGASAGRLAAFTGPLGATDHYARMASSGNVATFETTRPLGAGEGLTIVVWIPKGVVSSPSAGQARAWWWRDNIGMVLGPAGLLIVLFYYVAVWRRVGRDPAAGTVVPRWDAPEGLSPALINYIDNKGFSAGGWTAFSASIIDLAVNGYLILDDLTKQIVVTRTPKPIAANVPVGQLAILRAVNAAGGRFSFDKTNGEKVQTAGQAFRQAIEKEHRGKYYRANFAYVAMGVMLSIVVLILILIFGRADPEILPFLLVPTVFSVVLGRFSVTVGRRFRRGGSLFSRIAAVITLGFIALVALLGIAGTLIAFVTEADLATQWPVVGSCIGIVLANAIFFFLMGAPTPLGRRLMDGIEGLRLYLTVAEKDRMNMAGAPEMSPQHFEKLLPYAVALGVERPWSQAFEAWLAAAGVGAAYAAGWYHGSSFGNFGDRMGSFSSSMASTIASTLPAPSSSSSSGFSGGSSGGGGGGGGGGGW